MFVVWALFKNVCNCDLVLLCDLLICRKKVSKSMKAVASC